MLCQVSPQPEKGGGEGGGRGVLPAVPHDADGEAGDEGESDQPIRHPRRGGGEWLDPSHAPLHSAGPRRAGAGRRIGAKAVRGEGAFPLHDRMPGRCRERIVRGIRSAQEGAPRLCRESPGMFPHRSPGEPIDDLPARRVPGRSLSIARRRGEARSRRISESRHQTLDEDFDRAGSAYLFPSSERQCLRRDGFRARLHRIRCRHAARTGLPIRSCRIAFRIPIHSSGGIAASTASPAAERRREDHSPFSGIREGIGSASMA